MLDLTHLAHNLSAFGIDLPEAEWRAVRRHASLVDLPAGHKIQSQTHVAEAWIFLASGIAASEQTWRDGSITIARFFEAGHICANFTSVWTRDIAADDLVALTPITGLSLPDHFFRREYLQGGRFGEYLRLKMIEAHLFAKELVCAKTSGRTEARYQFLVEQHRDVVGQVQQKDIARFLGITPQALSRFHRKRSAPDG